MITPENEIRPDIDAKVIAWLTIVFPDIRDIEDKIGGINFDIKGRIAALVSTTPDNYVVTDENKSALREIYNEHLQLIPQTA